MKGFVSLMIYTLVQTGWSQDEGDFTPFPPSSAWLPIPAGLEGGRLGDQLVLQSTSGNKLGITQTPDPFSTGMTVKVDSLSGAPGSKAGISMYEDPRFGSSGFSVFVEPTGLIKLDLKSEFQQTLHEPEAPFEFPFYLKIYWSGAGFYSSISQNGADWENLVYFPIEIAPVVYEVSIQSSSAVEKAIVAFSEVSLLGADSNDNGIMDGWELVHFNRVLRSSDPSDPDLDGRSNIQEWSDRTDPNHYDQKLRHELRLVEENFELTISSFIWDDIYLERSDNLTHWQTVPYSNFNLRYNRDQTMTFEIPRSTIERYYFRTRIPNPLTDIAPDSFFQSGL